MNPIYRAEVRHQDYVLRTNRSPTLWIVVALVLLVPALIASGAFTVLVGVLGARLPPIPLFSDIDSMSEVFYTVGAVSLITMNLAHYLVVALVSSGLAVMSVQREQRNKTWDILVLTQQNARAIALGKVAASLWVLRRDTAIVTILRVGLLMLAVDLIRDLYVGPQFTPFDALFLTLWVVLWTVMDTVLSVAAAIASTLIPQWRPVMLPVALAVRGITLFGGVFWLAGMINRMLSAPDRLRVYRVRADRLDDPRRICACRDAHGGDRCALGARFPVSSAPSRLPKPAAVRRFRTAYDPAAAAGRRLAAVNRPARLCTGGRQRLERFAA
ncbi:MAG: hypothetical protein HND48_00710 [Chloroflexi bacterium]|nr:hypothetical protein [Chloroflexota bacterium]